MYKSEYKYQLDEVYYSVDKQRKLLRNLTTRRKMAIIKNHPTIYGRRRKYIAIETTMKRRVPNIQDSEMSTRTIFTGFLFVRWYIIILSCKFLMTVDVFIEHESNGEHSAPLQVKKMAVVKLGMFYQKLWTETAIHTTILLLETTKRIKWRVTRPSISSPNGKNDTGGGWITPQITFVGQN